jgi:NAD(P)H-flavin reductase
MVLKEEWICAIAIMVGALLFNYFFLHSGKYHSKLHPFEV